ncbi:putative lanthionine synthetase C family protein [Talaromyces proteolyticus]|uniref:Lanthionine synthetase C family protein n=1 Tax=Talaromyces proteolyticus TaxID=1131652 RepID=A0AAD4PVU4_9EURO|nr:putative lanthionine synthetase C family protein [Talaromyces proteolyticus]KAH8697140.1 putative lanthionine synthetase C family protein [Talaromyces proteolyticus]
MSSTRPQFYANTLPPAEINKASLESTLQELQLAIKNGVDIIRNFSQRPTDASSHGNIYSGISGIVFALLRLERQKASILENELDSSDHRFGELALDLIPPAPTEVTLVDGRNSPIASALGPVFTRILAVCEDQNLRLGRRLSIIQEDAATFNQAIETSTQHGNVISFNGHKVGGDEIFFGRAGLLWAILTIERHCYEEQTAKAVKPLLAPAFQAMPRLVDAIISAGKQSAQDFEIQHGKKAPLPLMWPWLGEHYALGAVHGISGILTMLLSCDLSLLRVGETNDYLTLIADTVNGLCQICIENNGHFPMSIPPLPSSEQRSSPLLQLCHGAPGIVILLGAVYQNKFFLDSFWKPEWQIALRLSTERIWEEGLLSKGGNLCHGLTGNIWPLLPFHRIYEYNSNFQMQGEQLRLAELKKTEGKATTIEDTKELFSSDFFLSRVLPFMLLARETPPYSEVIGIKPSFDFRAPDRPYSLGEGLAGKLCAWAETCTVIKARLEKMKLQESGNDISDLEQDENYQKYLSQHLGLPLFEVNGPTTYAFQLCLDRATH